jgi:flagellar biogenesis protein FliO
MTHLVLNGRRWGVALATCLLLGMPAARADTAGGQPVLAADARVSDLYAESVPDSGGGGLRDMAGTLLRLVGWTVGVIAAAGAGLLLLRRFTPVGRTLHSSGIVRIAGRTALSPRHSVDLVRVGSQRLLVVGVSGDRMVTLSEIQDVAGIVACDDGFRAALDSYDDAPEPVAADESAERRPGFAFGLPREVERIRGMLSNWRELLGRSQDGRTDDAKPVHTR